MANIDSFSSEAIKDVLTGYDIPEATLRAHFEVHTVSALKGVLRVEGSMLRVRGRSHSYIRRTLKRYSFFLLYIFFKVLNVSMWKGVKSGIGILRTTVSTHNAPIARNSWHLQFFLEKQRIFVILSLT